MLPFIFAKNTEKLKIASWFSGTAIITNMTISIFNFIKTVSHQGVP